MIAASVAVAALALATPAHGSLFTAIRYADWYSSYSTADGFNNNVVQKRPYDSKFRTYSMYPSLAESILVSSLDFPPADQPVETRIFNGVMRVPACRAGVYRFRVTSDDASDLFVDHAHVLTNPGKHGPTSMETTVHLKADTKHQFELWWGNWGGSTTLKVEYCYSSAATLKAREAGALSSEEGSPSLDDVDLGDAEADNACVFTSDLSKIFIEQDDVPAIQRCDFEGYWGTDISKLPTTTRFMKNGACALELGGVISMDLGTNAASASFLYEMKIKPRATGTHNFWLLSDDGSQLWVDSTNVVNNGGIHDDMSKQGRIYLEEGVEYKVVVVYGNSSGNGALRVHWTDPLSKKPQDNFLPILQPWK